VPDADDLLIANGASIRLADARRNLPAAQRSKVDMRQLSLPGTRILAGQVFEDPLVELQGLRGLQLLERMSLDPTVAALLRGVELPIRSARWIVEPASEDPKHVAMADYMHWCLYEFGTQSMDDVLRQALQMNWSGFSVSEIVYDIVQDGEYANYVGWDKLSYMHPFSKWRWNVEEVDSPSGSRIRRLVSMTQLAPPLYVETVVPREKMLMWVHDQLGENFDGRPLIRQAYKAYFYKDLLQKIQAIGLERAYVGIPHISYPEDFTDAEVAAARVIGENLRTSENAAAIAPEHIGVAILTNKIEGTAMQTAIDRHDTNILKSCLAQFIDLGTKSVGSYSLSQDQSELFLMALNALANYTAQVFNLEPGIPQLMRFNFDGVTAADMPRLSHGIVGQGRNLDKLARGMGVLSQWGILTPDDSLEDWVREQLEAPERDNTITDEALGNLIETIAGQTLPSRQHGQPRYPIPGTAAGMGVVVEPQPPTAPTNGTTPGGADVITSKPSQATFDEAWSRRRWARPQGRLTDTDRSRIRATEAFFSALEDVRRDLGHKPERPSVRVARRRRPYAVRMAETPTEVARRVNRDAKDGRLRPAGQREQVVVPQHQVVASQYEGQLTDFLAGIGKR
jgi:hypothetical protein